MESLLLYFIRQQIKYLIAVNLHIALEVTFSSEEKRYNCFDVNIKITEVFINLNYCELYRT